MTKPGELAIVLHTHMPYVEGFGTWPFGEEWLWEAIATSYLPVLRVLDEAQARSKGGEPPLTLSLTPVLADQLAADGAIERCITFLNEIRPASHALDIELALKTGDTTTVAELERSTTDYTRAADELEAQKQTGGLLAAFARYTTWTSAATHPILPLLALRESVDLQLRTGIESHRRRFRNWDGGLWLPECAHDCWLDPLLAEHGVTHTCVELTPLHGPGASEHLAPIEMREGPVLVPIDRATIDLVWGTRGYPSRDAYRDRHNLTVHHHRVNANDGAPYDRDRAVSQARADAAEFVAAVKARLDQAGGGLCVCALDTELLGHWWYEGPDWLAGVLDESDRQGLRLTALDIDAVSRHATSHPTSSPLPATTWGEGRDLRTWSGPAVADLAFAARTAELDTFAGSAPPPRALRELMALQSSDWAFMVSRRWAAEYPRQRASGHAAQLQAALETGTDSQPELRHLAPVL